MLYLIASLDTVIAASLHFDSAAESVQELSKRYRKPVAVYLYGGPVLVFGYRGRLYTAHTCRRKEHGDDCECYGWESYCGTGFQW